MTTQNFSDWYVATPPTTDSSYRIANTQYVQSAIAASVSTVAISQLATVAGLTMLANNSTGTSAVTATTISNFLDTAIGSTVGRIVYRNSATWVMAGGAVLLNTLLPNNVGSALDTTTLGSTFSNYLITLENVCPASSTTTLQMRLSTNLVLAWATTGYVSFAQVNVSAVVVTDAVTSAILLTGTRATTQVATSTNYGISGYVQISNPASGLHRTQVIGNTGWLTPNIAGISTTTIAAAETYGFLDTSNAIVGISFLFNSGNIQTGTIKIFGLT